MVRSLRLVQDELAVGPGQVKVTRRKVDCSAFRDRRQNFLRCFLVFPHIKLSHLG